MKAMILAAGLGSRLKPWTLEHPKALVPVGGVPMLERVILKLKSSGFDNIVINIHHFGEQIIEFVESRDFGVDISISDERDNLLDTGGGILHAEKLLRVEEGPVLIHNVDIISNADLQGFMQRHMASGFDSSLLVSDRDSSRKLIFGQDMRLRGWHNISDDIYRPAGFEKSETDREYAFSGIHIVGRHMIEEMKRLENDSRFSIIDFLLRPDHKLKIRGENCQGLSLIDIGKPATLSQAEKFL
ncbi:MAG: NTP transferase domain-containing protein [Muribaculaceae bacterium]|nr:NTP transferase domain-containing protein [Muribaculaceae bacterium]